MPVVGAKNVVCMNLMYYTYTRSLCVSVYVCVPAATHMYPSSASLKYSHGLFPGCCSLHADVFLGKY